MDNEELKNNIKEAIEKGIGDIETESLTAFVLIGGTSISKDGRRQVFVSNGPDMDLIDDLAHALDRHENMLELMELAVAKARYVRSVMMRKKMEDMGEIDNLLNGLLGGSMGEA